MSLYEERNSLGSAEKEKQTGSHYSLSLGSSLTETVPSPEILNAALPVEDFDDPNINKEEALAGMIGQYIVSLIVTISHSC